MRSVISDETIVMAFPAEHDAQAALEALRQRQATEGTKLRRAAVIARSGKGALDISETHDVAPTKKGLIIALIGLSGFVLGLLWRGARFGVILGVVAGQIGAIVASVIDLGFGDVYLNELATGVQADRSALVVTLASPTSPIVDLLLKQFPGATLVASAVVNREGLPIAHHQGERSRHARYIPIPSPRG